jgi:cytosine/adenosine deaminase-related metal-dependent hydrolase
MIAKSATSKLPLRNILLGRPIGSLEEEELDRILAISDGFGLSSPLVYDTGSLELIRRKAGKKIVATHVSETRNTYNQGDFELAIKYLKPDIIVHGVYLSQEQILEIVERDISLVACPRSNMWFSAGSPPLAEALDSGANVALGTDNAGWINPNLWREMELAWNLIRLRGKFDVKAKDILKMVTTNAAKALKMDKLGMICEEYEASFIVLNASYLNLDFAHDKLAAIVKRGCGEAILAIFFKGQRIDRSI